MKKIYRFLLYILCLYDIYLYLPDILDLFKINFFAPTADMLMYFDAGMLLIGGIIVGTLLIKLGGKINKGLEILMIVMNVVLTPLFILRALP